MLLLYKYYKFIELSMMRKKRNNRKFRVSNNPIKSLRRKKRIINQKITKMLKSNLIVIVKKRQK
jgi:hypothetical protein